MQTILLFKVIIAAVVGFCGLHDARHLTIPNKYLIGMIALFPLAALLNPAAFPITGHLMAAGIVFGLSFILFSLKLMGGGDSKMAAVVALWLGLKSLIPFIVIMAVMGGLLASISLILKRNKHLIPKNVTAESWFGQLKENKSVVPYGIAIATGAVFALF